MYMLRELHFSYLEFTASGIAVILAQTSAFRFWGRVADRYGNRFVLSLTGVGVVLVPLPWLLSQRFEYVLGFQVFSGLWWSGFQLGVANFIFDAVTPGRRARCVAYHNTLMHGAVLAGATVGGLLAPRLPALLPYAGALGLVSGLQVLFALSSLLRAGFVAAFIAAVREVRPVEPAPRLRALVHAVGAFPVRGLRLSLFTGDEREEDEETTAAEAGDETRTPLDQRRPSAQGPS
jgi:MFS family permease